MKDRYFWANVIGGGIILFIVTFSLFIPQRKEEIIRCRVDSVSSFHRYEFSNEQVWIMHTKCGSLFMLSEKYKTGDSIDFKIHNIK